MPDTVETAEIQLEMTGLDAAQQALDALGVDAEEIDSATDSEGSDQGPAATDLAPLLAALNRQTELLERIAAALEGAAPQPPQPTY